MPSLLLKDIRSGLPDGEAGKGYIQIQGEKQKLYSLFPAEMFELERAGNAKACP